MSLVCLEGDYTINLTKSHDGMNTKRHDINVSFILNVIVCDRHDCV